MAHSQDLTQHRWKHRVLLLVSEHERSDQLQQQLQRLKAVEAGVEERKLFIYQLTPKGYRTGLATSGKWLAGSERYEQYQKEGQGFTCLLIGLDGGVKLRRYRPLLAEEIFGTIDQMPMRRAEMRRKKND